MLRFEIRGVKEAVAYTQKTPGKIFASLLKSMEKVAGEVATKVKTEKLSNQVLHVRTGNLRRNVKADVRVEGSAILGVVGVRDTVPYGRIHELGGMAGPGRKVFIPARPYLRTTLEEMYPGIQVASETAVDKALEKGS